MIASSEAMTMSADKALSDPPPTHQPWICAITGLGDRHMEKNCCVGATSSLVDQVNSLPGSHLPSLAIQSSQWWKPPSKL